MAPISNTWVTIATVSIVAVSAGCGGIPRVDARLITQAQQYDSTMTITTLESARTRYVTRCSSCHALYQPADYAPDDWTMWMRKMTPKAKLTKDEADNVLTYILAARTTPHSP